jgi:hypothetical protein
MLLDVVLAHRDVTWLATEREKVDYFVGTRELHREDLPSVSFGDGDRQTVRYFTEKLPIGRGTRYEEVVFVYLVMSPDSIGLQRFLSAHRVLFRRLRCWTLRLVFPRFLERVQLRFQAVAESLFAPPLRMAVVDEFKWFCQARRLVEAGAVGRLGTEPERYARDRAAFGAHRFHVAYREWLKGGDVTLNSLLTPLLQEGWQRGDMRVVCEVLPHRYLDVARTAAMA